MSFAIYAVLLVIWAAVDLVLISVLSGRALYGRRVTDMKKRKDDPPDEAYMGLGFVVPFLAAWRKMNPWSGEERRDHERRSGI